MKWPTELLLIRHAESAYNSLKKIRMPIRSMLDFESCSSTILRIQNFNPLPKRSTKLTPSVAVTATHRSPGKGNSKPA